MQNLRTLRRSQALGLLELAARSGIPARQIVEVESGMRRLSRPECMALAHVLGVPADDVIEAYTRPCARSQALQRQHRRQPLEALLALSLVAGVASAALSDVVPLPLHEAPRVSLAAPAAVPPPAAGTAAAAPALVQARASTAQLRQQLATPAHTATEADQALAPTLLVASAVEDSTAWLADSATEADQALAPALLVATTFAESTALPPPAATPRFFMSTDGPVGCPLVPTAGQVVITQAYGEGTHSPAEIWGALDLAVDGNGDGLAEPGASWYQPVVATHAGVVHVKLDSDPGGNYVAISAPDGLWWTSYAHLAIVTVSDGAYVQAGELIGLLGASGKASGPHLDYQIWRGGQNIDPTSLVTAW